MNIPSESIHKRTTGQHGPMSNQPKRLCTLAWVISQPHAPGRNVLCSFLKAHLERIQLHGQRRLAQHQRWLTVRLQHQQTPTQRQQRVHARHAHRRGLHLRGRGRGPDFFRNACVRFLSAKSKIWYQQLGSINRFRSFKAIDSPFALFGMIREANHVVAYLTSSLPSSTVQSVMQR